MFVSNIFNFATEGKCFRYGSVKMPIGLWGPWHTPFHKTEGSLIDVKMSVEDVITPAKVVDIFQFFTIFATDKKYQNIKLFVAINNMKEPIYWWIVLRLDIPNKDLFGIFRGRENLC